MWREKKKRSSINNFFCRIKKKFRAGVDIESRGKKGRKEGRKEGSKEQGREGRKEGTRGRKEGRKEGRNEGKKSDLGFYNSYLEVDLQLGKDYKTYTIIPISSSLHDMGLRFGV